ncbi:hypothetical protein [Psychrobacter sp. DAB_AL43B]|uniref:hypothetical protein n=1 Tax=Psychrobacter sp. DAB_AL43B TaxID=1028416 RepID=UPI0009A8057B|nr:hypothetical protein [Psychrobacter sp. DAB_AL43B]SLJ85621.1 hypothetical protein DABAL43B_2437 [Psychrobacter sp. DAB_AL43B]
MNTISTTKALTLSALLLSLSACVIVSPPTNEDTLTDADLIRAAQKKESAPTEGAQQWVIGYHHGIEVVKSFQCSDLCPQNTLRLIYYDVPTDATCESIGGVTKSILVPIAITVMPKDYCFPAVIADYWESYP